MSVNEFVVTQKVVKPELRKGNKYGIYVGKKDSSQEQRRDAADLDIVHERK